MSLYEFSENITGGFDNEGTGKTKQRNWRTGARVEPWISGVTAVEGIKISYYIYGTAA
jgi:hypothetical protein